MSTPTISPEGDGYAHRGDTARPVGVSILAILTWIGAAGLLLLAMFFLFLGALLGATGEEGAAIAGTVVGGFVGGIILIVCLVEALIGYGLWTGRNWAWILAIIGSGFYAIAGLIGLSQGGYESVVPLGLAGGMLWYLFQPGVKRYFGQAA